MVLFLPLPGFTKPGSKRWKEMAPPTIIPSDSSTKCYASYFMTLCSASLEVIAAREEILPPIGKAMIPLKW